MYVRTQMPKHTRACLLVGFCSSSGYTLLNNVAAPGAPEFYSSDGFVATLEQGAAGGGKMFDFLSYASTCPVPGFFFPPPYNFFLYFFLFSVPPLRIFFIFFFSSWH